MPTTVTCPSDDYRLEPFLRDDTRFCTLPHVVVVLFGLGFIVFFFLLAFVVARSSAAHRMSTGNLRLMLYAMSLFLSVSPMTVVIRHFVYVVGAFEVAEPRFQRRPREEDEEDDDSVSTESSDSDDEKSDDDEDEENDDVEKGKTTLSKDEEMRREENDEDEDGKDGREDERGDDEEEEEEDVEAGKEPDETQTLVDDDRPTREEYERHTKLRVFGYFVVLVALIYAVVLFALIFVDLNIMLWMFVGSCGLNAIGYFSGNAIRNALDGESRKPLSWSKYSFAFALEFGLTAGAAGAFVARTPVVSWVLYDAAAALPIAFLTWDALLPHLKSYWWWFRNRTCFCCIPVTRRAWKMERITRIRGEADAAVSDRLLLFGRELIRVFIIGTGVIMGGFATFLALVYFDALEGFLGRALKF